MLASDLIYVFAYLSGELTPQLAGQLKLLPGLAGSVFSYDAAYLQMPGAYALDPFALPLGSREFAFSKHQGALLPGALEDAGPDQWGRQLIDREYPQMPRRSDFDYLLAAGNERTGALVFGESPVYGEPEDRECNHIEQLKDIEEAAQRVRAGLPIEQQHMRLLRRGTSLGGMRPKCLVEDEGALWIAKFNARDEDLDAVSLEYAAMTLAQACGIVVPHVRKVQFAKQHAALLVMRFDRWPMAGGYGRIPYLSSKTLMRSYGIAMEGESPMEYGYPLLAEAMRATIAPLAIRQDCAQLFRRMVFNILIDNTDDHEKNHGFLLSPDGWRLSPAFDVSSQLLNLGYQGMVVGKAGTESTLENALSESARFGLDQEMAVTIVNEVKDCLCIWEKHYLDCGVSEKAVEKVGQGFGKRKF